MLQKQTPIKIIMIAMAVMPKTIIALKIVQIICSRKEEEDGGGDEEGEEASCANVDGCGLVDGDEDGDEGGDEFDEDLSSIKIPSLGRSLSSLSYHEIFCFKVLWTQKGMTLFFPIATPVQHFLALSQSKVSASIKFLTIIRIIFMS